MRSCKPLALFGLLTAALTLVATVLRSVALITSFDAAVGYFDASIFSTLLYIVIALAVVSAFGYALYAQARSKKEQSPLPTPDVTHRTVAARIAGAAVVLVLLALSALELPAILIGQRSILSVLRLVAPICAIPYFVLTPSRRTGWFGVFTHVVCILCLVTEYFDRYVVSNSPLKLSHQIAFVMAMLYLLTELFDLVGQPQPIRVRYLAPLAFFFTVTNGVSLIVAVAVREPILSIEYLLRAMFLLTLGLYIAARTVPFFKKEEY